MASGTMTAVDDPTPSWNNFTLAETVTVPFSRHAEPTTLCKSLMDQFDAASTEPFTDTLQLFQSSHDLAPIGLKEAV